MKTGDSMSWTSLSIWMSIGTVISSSALLKSKRDQILTEAGEESGDCKLTRFEEARSLVRKLEQANRA